MGNNYFYLSKTGNGYENLALDEWMLDHVREDDLILYLYVNSNAVIIGKNQNPRKECDLARMQKDGVQLVRRISGGGAVYHDTGNLNFSFIAGKNRYDKDAQHRFILDVVSSFGIDCSFSGRNDLLANGKKFSGNAYCQRQSAKQHHGTLLVSADLGKLQNYLRPDPRKLRSKGVDSVRSRVCNLAELLPGLTTAALQERIRECFRQTYGSVLPLTLSDADRALVDRYVQKHASEAWVLGETPEFNEEIDLRTPIGMIDILFNVKEWKISSCKVYTDANDDRIAQTVERLLTGLPYEKELLAHTLAGCNDCDLTALAEEILKA